MRHSPTSNGSKIAIALAVGVGVLLLARKASAMTSQDLIARMAVVLTPAQTANAQIIADEFSAAGQPDNLIAAAIVNAWVESKLNAKASGDSGHSIGLFQLSDWGAGAGLTRTFREDPHNNAKTILEREVLKPRGAVLRQRAKEGAGVEELAAIFSRDIERPKDRAGEMAKRKDLAQTMFPTMVTGADSGTAAA